MITVCQQHGVILQMTGADREISHRILVIEEVLGRRFPKVTVTTQQIGPFEELHHAIEAAEIIEDLIAA